MIYYFGWAAALDHGRPIVVVYYCQIYPEEFGWSSL